MCLSTLWNGQFDRFLANTLFRCLITGRILLDLSVLSSLPLLEKWRFCKIYWNLVRVMTFWIFSFSMHLCVDQKSFEDGNSMIPIVKFIPRNAFISSSVVSKLQPFCAAYLFVSITMISISSFIPVTIWNMSKGLDEAMIKIYEYLFEFLFFIGFSLFSYFRSLVVLVFSLFFLHFAGHCTFSGWCFWIE